MDSQSTSDGELENNTVSTEFEKEKLKMDYSTQVGKIVNYFDRTHSTEAIERGKNLERVSKSYENEEYTDQQKDEESVGLQFVSDITSERHVWRCMFTVLGVCLCFACVPVTITQVVSTSFLISGIVLLTKFGGIVPWWISTLMFYLCCILCPIPLFFLCSLAFLRFGWEYCNCSRDSDTGSTYNKICNFLQTKFGNDELFGD